MTNAALITPRDGATGNGPGLPAAKTRRQRNIAYCDGRLASKRDLAKRNGKRLKAIEQFNWLQGRCAEIALNRTAKDMLELIARLMKGGYVLNKPTIKALAKMMDISPQRGSVVFSELEESGVIYVFRKPSSRASSKKGTRLAAIYLRLDVLENAPSSTAAALALKERSATLCCSDMINRKN